MIKRIMAFSLLLGLFLLLCGCASNTKCATNTESICDLENLTLQDTTPTGPTVSKIRIQALKDTALSIGAQGALALRSKELNAMLEPKTKQLGQIYNFNGLMLDHNVLPPVLQESAQSLNLQSPDVLTLSDHTYKIVQQARFVTAPPTWREYLELDYKKPTIPDSTLLPKDKQERQIWKKYIRIGWQNGLNQANNIYADNLATLKRDYAGMMLYRDLLAKHMVTKPHVIGHKLGVTSNADQTEIQINNQTLQIAATPKFRTNSRLWKPVLEQKR